MAALVTGSCNCGRHRYTIPKATEMNLCHCIDCRRWAGAFHSAHLFVKTGEIKSQGPQPETYVVKADSGKEMERAWCGGCGTGIWLKELENQEMTYLKAGLFEPHDIPYPTMENWLKNLEKWETPAKGTKRISQVN